MNNVYFNKSYTQMRFRLCLLFALIVGVFNSLFTQSTILADYVQEALNNNLSIRSEVLKKDKQYSKIEQAKKRWNPSVNLDASYLFAKGGRLINFPTGDLFNPVYSTLNQVTGSNDFPTDLENQNIQLTPNNFLDVQLAVSKPLINSSIRYNQMIQEELLRLNDVDIALSKEDIAFQTKSGYFNYLKTFEGLSILEETEVLLNEVLSFNRKLIKYDKATPDILSDVEFQLANIQSQRAVLLEQQQLAKAYFNLLRNQPLASEITVDETIVNGSLPVTASFETLKSQALSQRLEFKKIDAATAVNSLNQQRIDKERLPTLGVSAGVGIQTEEFNFDIGGPLYTLALGMNWNIFDGGLRQKRMEEIEVDQQILANDKNRLQQQVEIEVTQIFYRLKSLQLQMQAEQVAVNSAQKSYDAIYKRYKNDKAILIELLQAQNSLTNSELTRALTKYDYLTALAELEKAVNQ